MYMLLNFSLLIIFSLKNHRFYTPRIDLCFIFLEVLLFVWVPLASLIGMSYQSNLLASLVRGNYEKPVDTFQDIIDLDLTLYVYKFAAGPFLLETSPFAKVREAYQKNTLDKGGLHGQSDLKDPDTQYIVDEIMRGEALCDYSDTFFPKHEHMFRMGRQLDFASYPVGFYFSLNNPVLRRMWPTFQRTVEGGVAQHLTRWFIWLIFSEGREYRNNEVVDEEEPASPLTPEHVLPIVLVNCIVFVLAILSFGLEVAIEKCKSREEKS